MSSISVFHFDLTTNKNLRRAVSTRMLCGVWCLFTLVMKSYTANLTAYLTNQRLEKTIRTVEELSNQYKIIYGAVTDGTTAAFFKVSVLLNVGFYSSDFDFFFVLIFFFFVDRL